MNDRTDEPTGSCLVCRVRDPHWPQVCDLCRSRLAQRLWEVRDLHALLPAALLPGQSAGQRVSGTRETPVPLRINALDLAGEARVLALTDRSTVEDQDGHLAVASVLDSWVRDWADITKTQLPAADVPSLVSWLSVRLSWACTEHPAVDEFARELTVTLYALRALLNVSRQPIHLDEPCPSCDWKALRRDPAGGDVECGNCRRTWRFEEFDRLATVLADDRTHPVTPTRDVQTDAACA